MFSFDEVCLAMVSDMVHENQDCKGGRIHNSAQLAGDCCNTRHMLYPGSVKALIEGYNMRCLCVLNYVFSCDEMCLVMLSGLVHGEF